METKSSLLIRPYEAEDKQHILAVYADVWGEEKAKNLAEIWSWKYETYLFGEQGIDTSFVAEKNGEIIGFFGAIPSRFKIHANVYSGCYLGDFMTSPQHRGSLGVRLARAIIAKHMHHVQIGHSASADSQDAIGYKLLSKLRPVDKDIGYICNLFKRVSIQGAVLDRCRLKFAARLIDNLWYFLQEKPNDTCPQSGLVLEQLNCFQTSDEKQINEIVDSYQNISIKTIDYLNWRYFKRPATQYIIYVAREQGILKGFITLRCINKAGKLNARIVDLMVTNGDEKTSYFLMSAAEAYFREVGVRQVRAYASKDSFLEAELTKFGFSSGSVSDPIFPLIGYSPDNNIFVQDAWHMALSDSDFDME